MRLKELIETMKNQGKIKTIELSTMGEIQRVEFFPPSPQYDVTYSNFLPPESPENYPQKHSTAGKSLDPFVRI